MTGLRLPRFAARLLVVVALAAAAVAVPPSGARADGAIDLMGDWTVDPFTWKVSGCRYEQWVVIRKRTGANTYTGVSRQRHNCFGNQGEISETQIVVTVEGRKVILTSSSPTWNTEVLQYISPYRMDGTDTLGHHMIYRRPKGPPGV
jgi:hypothetical protein